MLCVQLPIWPSVVCSFDVASQYSPDIKQQHPALHTAARASLTILRARGVRQVSDGKATEDPAEEMEGKTRFGRPALSARLLASTKFDVSKKAVMTNLHSTNAAGQPVFARYYIALGDESKAASFASLAQSCCPAA